MFSLITLIRERFGKTNPQRKVLVGCGVMFPDIEFKPVANRGQEMIPEIIFDMTTKDITQYMNGLFDYWESRQHRKPDKLSPRFIKEVVDFLRGDFICVPSLSNRLDAIEERYFWPSIMQQRLLLKERKFYI